MRHLHFSESLRTSYPICFLVPTIQGDEIQKAYIKPHAMDPNEMLVLDLHTAKGPGGRPSKKKIPVKEMKLYLSEEVQPVLDDMGVDYVVVADGDYFKAMTGAAKAEANLGYVLPSILGTQNVIYVPNHRSIFYDPDKVTAKIDQGINALLDHRQGTYQAPGHGIIHSESYPSGYEEIKKALDMLLRMGPDVHLTSDIEAFGLKHHTAGIGTITFGWNKHEGLAFAVDYEPIPWDPWKPIVLDEDGELLDNPITPLEPLVQKAPFGRQVLNAPVRELLKDFFIKLSRQKGRKLIWHSISYDVYVLIYQLFMKDILDTKGLLEGMKIMLADGQWDCTKLITYLATNSCSGNKLGLKENAQEFAGDYAMGDSIKDITKIPLDKLLRYNLVDGLSTWHVYEKHWDTLVADSQLEIYETIFKPATLDIIQMQLTGMPINRRRTRQVRWMLYKEHRATLKAIQQSPLVQRFTYELNERWVEKRNTELKVKRVSMADAKEVFNPNSDPQMRALLYDMLGMPVLDLTDSKLPATGWKTLTKLINHAQKDEVKKLLQAMIDFGSVDKILTSFIPAMLAAAEGPDGWHYLSGNFNLGGTVSGRLSSSDPNLQNIPASSKWAKLIKSCFEAPPGWIFAGLDFASLEDKISALTTKDPNKLKVYTDGYDGHSLRAFAYWRDLMPDIEDTVESINSIAVRYKPLRNDSKAPTFLLTYGGTYMGMMANCGFPLDKAISIEAKYHELYQVSDQWVAAKITEAGQTGYITGAFGLRVRTPLVRQVIRGNRATPHEAEAEGRTAGNALGQSWCLLNSRAASEFMGIVREGIHALDIRPCAHIHDAQYYLIRDDVSVVAYTNKHLVKAVQWQDHPDIWHDEVKIGGELSLFWPDWTKEIGIFNGADEADIISIINKATDQ